MTSRDPDPAPAAAGGGPISAARLGELLGDRLPAASSVSSAAVELADAVRDLVDAVVRTDAGDDVRARLASSVRAAAGELRARQRDPVIVLVRHDDGRLENLTQAGNGRLNPRAPALRFEGLHAPPADGGFAPVEVVGRCTLDAGHSGGPGRAHGSVVAGLLDEALGVAATSAGASGLTVHLEVRFRAGAPLGEQLRVTARCGERSGRKSFASGELWHGERLVAEASAVFVSEARP